jgi:hypothetical protein
MRKATHYKVSGVLETKPANLPEGLNVEEVEVTLPKHSVDIRAIHGGSAVHITEYDLCKSSYENPGMMIPGKGIFEGSEVRKLRDFLNVVLGEDKFVGRVLVDGVNDVWFEFEPDVWTQGNDRVCTNPNPWQRAKARLSEANSFSDGLTRKPLKTIEDLYGPVEFIVNEWA